MLLSKHGALLGTLVVAMHLHAYLAATRLVAAPKAEHSYFAVLDDSPAGNSTVHTTMSSSPRQEAGLLHAFFSVPGGNTSVRSSSTSKTSNQKCRKAIRERPRNCRSIRKHCAEYGNGIVGYIELYFCNAIWPAGILAAMTLWLGILFVWLGVSASEYFSPNISTLSLLLRLPESLAGVTLLALGNGAPDLFSTFSAVKAGSGALAIGQLVGSASFIISIVAGATTLIVPRYKVNRLSYLRELVFFVATIAIVAMIVVTERLSRGLALCMVGLYAAYVIAVMVTTYYEEQCRDLGLTDEDDWLCNPVHVPREASLDIHERPLLARFQSRSYGALPVAREPIGLFDNSSTSALSGAEGRRRQTVGIPHANYVSGDILAPGFLGANGQSVRALGEILHQHRRSLLAAAEFQDILGEMRESQSYDSGYPGADRIENSSGLHPSGQRPSRIPPNSFSASQNTPPPWNNYKIQSLAGPHEPTSGSNITSSSVERDSSSYQMSDSASNYLQITPTNTTAAHTRPVSILASVASSTWTPTPVLETPSIASASDDCEPSTQKSDYLSPVFCGSNQQTKHHCSRNCNIGSRQAGSPVSHATPCSQKKPLSDRLPSQQLEVNTDISPTSLQTDMDVAGSVPLSSRHAFHSASIVDMLAASPNSPLLVRHPHQAPSIAVDVDAIHPITAVRHSKLSALAYTCIPTLRLWRHDASKPLKGFIAVSAIPVLLLTLTVPVMHEVPPQRSDISDLQTQSEPDLERLGNPVSGAGGALQRGRLEGPISETQANIEWAEEMTSLTRSVTTVPFLLAALRIGGSVLDFGLMAHLAIAFSISALSLAGNYISRHRPDPPYWLQITPCFVGFVSGLAWVYLIADEIVSITQALGVILDLSEEILGLTIVGFGNSLGDLVTNLTLTRMGYPMMAISACFGGPMLCLLLGVGVAAFSSLAGGKVSGGAYWIPLTSPTVLVSTACLLFNSMLFLVVVPRQKYHMSRAVGLVAIFVYFIGMTVNVYLEW